VGCEWEGGIKEKVKCKFSALIMCIYIYVYVERERERETERKKGEGPGFYERCVTVTVASLCYALRTDREG
jgi:hypothetical protein